MRKKVLIIFIIAVLAFWGFTNSVNATISLEDNILGSWTYCSVEKVGDTQKDFKEIIGYTNIEELGTFNFYSDNVFTILRGGKFTTDFENLSDYEKKYSISDNKVYLDTTKFSRVFEFNEETGMLIQDYQVEIDNELQEYKLYLKKTKNVISSQDMLNKLLGGWTYCSVEKKNDKQKDFKEIVNYTNVEELGTFNFYSDNTFTIFSGGKFTTDFDNPSEYEKKYKIANNKINIETANFSITFEYDEETGLLVENYIAMVDNELQEYTLYLKKTKNVISNQDMLNKLLGNWTYCSVEKKHNTQKDFKEIVNYTNIEELGTFSFYKDNTFTIRSGGKFTMDFENPSESVKKYTIQNNKINIETANFLITFEYDEKTGMLIQDYQVVVDNKLQGYRLYLKKEADNSSINSEKEDSTTSKFELPKAGISNFIAIMILSTIVIFIIIGIKMKKMKDVK